MLDLIEKDFKLSNKSDKELVSRVEFEDTYRKMKGIP